MRKLAPGLALLFACFNADAQDRLNDNSTDSLIAAYNSQRGAALPIFNGRQYIGYSHQIQGFPSYLSSDWQQGSVLYDGRWYHGISLMYDSYQDQVVVRSPNGFPYVLVNYRVSEFNFAGQHFISIKEGMENKLKPGFYQRLRNGKAELLVKRIKKLEERVNGSEIDRRFLTADKFFIVHNNQLTAVSKQRDLLDALKERRQDVQNHLRSQNLNFKQDTESAIASAVDFFNQLTN